MVDHDRHRDRRGHARPREASPSSVLDLRHGAVAWRQCDGKKSCRVQKTPCPRPDAWAPGSRARRVDSASTSGQGPARCRRVDDGQGPGAVVQGGELGVDLEVVPPEDHEHQQAGDQDRPQGDPEQGDEDVALGGLDQDAGTAAGGAGRARVAAGALDPRLDRRRDNVALLYLLALVGLPDPGRRPGRDRRR